MNCLTSLCRVGDTEDHARCNEAGWECDCSCHDKTPIEEALEAGGLDDQCLEGHPESVCKYCGACRACASGCGCEGERT